MQLPRSLLDKIEQHPLWKRCYPRVYAEPSCGQYSSPKEIGRHLLSIAMRLETEGFGNLEGLGKTEQIETTWAADLIDHQVPTYWIGHDMALAIQQTVPPMLFDWKDTGLPFESMVFMVPKGIIKHEDEAEGEAVFIGFMRSRPEHIVPAFSPVGPRTMHSVNPAFTLFASTMTGDLMHWTMVPERNGAGVVNLAELDALVQTFEEAEHLSSSLFGDSLNLLDNRFMARVAHFIFGTLLLMLTRPEVVTTGRLERTIRTKAGKVNEFWSPNVVGAAYHIQRPSLGGTHASPRLHWVRGAYREQHYGEKRSLVKRIWVEPYLRGEGEEQC